MSSAKKVYYQDSGYPIQRNLVDLPLQKFKIKKKAGILKVLNHIHYKIRGVNPFLENSHWELFRKSNAIWHFFNGVSFGKTPWVVTFETSLPRWRVESKTIILKGIQALADEPCKKLIALSACTKRIQMLYMKENFPSFAKSIAQKLTVIHPPQQPLINSYQEKRLPNDKLVFTLIGADFFRKGGKEILFTFDTFLKEDAPIELQIVSSMNYGDYASKATPDDLKASQAIIDAYPNRIHHYNHLPNDKVLDLLKTSHVGLLPTYGDTYGYAVLEAQAAGCPVITTDIRALPEINNDSCGWMIDVAKDKWGDGILDTVKDRTKFSDNIYEKLHQIIGGIISKPENIEIKGRQSLGRIKENHNPKDAARRLERIYDEAFGL